MERAHNFNAGPAALPLEALERTARELVDFEGTGMSVLEHSHRDAPYERVHREALGLVRSYLGVPDTHEVLFLQGGARTQFAHLPMNFLHRGASADYVVTGTWAKQAYEEAGLVANLLGGRVRLVASTEDGGKFTRVPRVDALRFDPAAAYVHLTSNNTLFGTQWAAMPDTGSVPLILDTTSDLGTRAIDWTRVAGVYAAAQKNLGPAGVTVLILARSLLERSRTDIPQILRYAAHSKAESLLNTPPVVAITVLRNTLRVLADRGGLAQVEAETNEKAARIYGVLDAHAGFYRAPVARDSRSLVNVVFALPSEALEQRFLSEAAELRLVGLKGHRSVGGLRASLYAAQPMKSVEALAGFMERFARTQS